MYLETTNYIQMMANSGLLHLDGKQLNLTKMTIGHLYEIHLQITICATD